MSPRVISGRESSFAKGSTALSSRRAKPGVKAWVNPASFPLGSCLEVIWEVWNKTQGFKSWVCCFYVG